MFDKKFLDKIQEDLKLSDLTSNNHTNIISQYYYLQILFEIKSTFIKLTELKESLYQELYNYYKYEYQKELKNNEIDIYIKSNEKWKKISEKYNDEKLKIEFLEEVVKLFQSRGFTIRNIIDIEKLKK